MIDWTEAEERPTPEAAKAALPPLIAETLQVIHQAETLAARLRANNSKLAQALAGIGCTSVAAAAPPGINFSISLPGRSWQRIETAISRLQASYPAMGIDDCLNDIFDAGLDRINRACDHDCTGV